MTKGRKRRHESGTPQKEGGDGTGLQDAIEELKAFIEVKTGKAVEDIKNVLEQKIASIEESLNFAYASITESSQKLNKLEEKMRDMSAERNDIQNRLARLEYDSEEAEKVRRRPMLIFSGSDLHIPENDRALKPSVAAFINRLMEIEVDQGQITSVQRMTRNRLLVSFSSGARGSLRDQVYKAKARLRGHDLYINENLTPVRQEAFAFLLEMRRQGKISAVVTRGGEVLYAIGRNDGLSRVRSRDEAEYRLRQEVGRREDRSAPPAPAIPATAPATAPAAAAEGGAGPEPSRVPGGGGFRDRMGRLLMPGAGRAASSAEPAAAPAPTAAGHMPRPAATDRRESATPGAGEAGESGVTVGLVERDRPGPAHLEAPLRRSADRTPSRPADRADRPPISERTAAVPLPEGTDRPAGDRTPDSRRPLQEDGADSGDSTGGGSRPGGGERHLAATTAPSGNDPAVEMSLVSGPRAAAERGAPGPQRGDPATAAEAGPLAGGMRDIRTYWR